MFCNHSAKNGWIRHFSSCATLSWAATRNWGRFRFLNLRTTSWYYYKVAQDTCDPVDSRPETAWAHTHRTHIDIHLEQTSSSNSHLVLAFPTAGKKKNQTKTKPKSKTNHKYPPQNKTKPTNPPNKKSPIYSTVLKFFTFCWVCKPKNLTFHKKKSNIAYFLF